MDPDRPRCESRGMPSQSPTVIPASETQSGVVAARGVTRVYGEGEPA